MIPSDDQLRAAAEVIASELLGTCDFLHSALERHDWDGYDDYTAFCDTLDNRVFCCTQCEWWFDVSDTGEDVNGQWACVECSPLEGD